jgi:hypothetical protein
VLRAPLDSYQGLDSGVCPGVSLFLVMVDIHLDSFNLFSRSRKVPHRRDEYHKSSPHRRRTKTRRPSGTQPPPLNSINTSYTHPKRRDRLDLSRKVGHWPFVSLRWLFSVRKPARLISHIFTHSTDLVLPHCTTIVVRETRGASPPTYQLPASCP